MGSEAMVERIRDLIDRFPEDEETIRQLIRSDPTFDSLCQEYKDIGDELRRLERRSDPAAAAEAEELKMRRRAVEEELLTRIEGYRPS
jgi:uncharacterized protein YdcH (DUF465 family)